jgi:hypothetical protein
MDCNLACEEALKAHPEWFERNQDGSPRPHGESPWLFATCMFSTYFSEQMPAIYREINEHYPVDGFFTNGWPSTGALRVCYCQSCRRLFDKLGGMPPAETDSSSPIYRKYYAAYMDRVLAIWRLWDNLAHEKNPQSVYVGNLGGGLDTVKDLRQISQVAAWFNADHQGRSGETPIWDCAQQGRVAYSVMEGRTVTNVAGAYSNAQPSWRHVSKAPAELTLWLAQSTDSGMVPWFHWLGGSPEDTRWREVGRSFFDWPGGRYVAFLSTATNLVPGLSEPGSLRVYLRDMCTGAPSSCSPATTSISIAGDGTTADDPSISADGRYITFASGAAGLVPGDTNGAMDVFVYDTCIGVLSGCAAATVRASVELDGTQGNNDSFRPAISADGRFVVFISAAKLGPGSPNSLGGDVYLARH